MKLLFDTHVLVWWLENNRRLGKRARRIIQSSETSVWVSAVSAWEISIKAGLQRTDVMSNVQQELDLEMDRSGFQRLAIEFEHAYAVRSLPRHHRDPFDHLLLAQAQCEGLTLVTADEILFRYGVPTLDAST